MSAIDALPLAGTVGALCTATGAALGHWLKGRAIAQAAVAASKARVEVAHEETGRHEIADRATHNVALMARLAALEAKSDRCHEDNAKMSVLLVNAAHDLDNLREELREERKRGEESVADRAALRVEVDHLRVELARWQGSTPTGSD